MLSRTGILWRQSLVFLTWLLVAMLSLSGCGGGLVRNPVPEELTSRAEIPEIPDARFWGDTLPADIEQRLRNIQQQLESRYPEIAGRQHNYLALSGGGAQGAFGAGLLAGWSEAGGRPEFDIVTGISIGALIAPFAFLGPDYDPMLRQVFTSTDSDQIRNRRGWLALLMRDAMANLDPLRQLLKQKLGVREMQLIAAEHAKGRRLFIGTTHLDAGRPVIWNLGAIASVGGPQALALIHEALLASASIPGAFEPIYFEVEVDGKRYDEMHVDGGAANQVFLFPAQLDWHSVAEALELEGSTKIYVIRNSKLAPKYEPVRPRALAITGRSVGSLIRTQGIGDLNRIYLQARQGGLEYRLAFIPSEFKQTPSESFDPVYMKALFQLAYEKALNGYPWLSVPPDLGLEAGKQSTVSP